MNFKPYITHILKHFILKSTFFVLPSTVYGPHNPRTLPREVFQSSSLLLASDSVGPKQSKKPGRISKKEKAIKARTTAEALTKWLERRSYAGDNLMEDSSQPSLGASTFIFTMQYTLK